MTEFYRGLHIDGQGSNWRINPRVGFAFPRSLCETYGSLESAKAAIDQHLVEVGKHDFSDSAVLLPTDWDSWLGWRLEKDPQTLHWFVAKDDKPEALEGQYTTLHEARRAVSQYANREVNQ